MRYELEKFEERQAFLAEWQERFSGARLLTLFRGDDDPPFWSDLDFETGKPFWSDEAVVLRTTAGDLVIMTDTAGARIETGNFEIIPGQKFRSFWFYPEQVWHEWPVKEVMGASFGEIRLYYSARNTSYPYYNRVAIQAGTAKWLIFEDITDLTHLSVVDEAPPLADA